MNEIFQNIWMNEISRIFSIIIVSYFAFAIFSINSNNPKIKALIHTAPSAMTSLGILGTFVGIFIGLLELDFGNRKSLELLLDGLRIAFSTSILGLTGAILFRLIRPVISRESVNNEDATIENIVDQLMRLDTSVNKASDTNLASLKDLRNALTDDKDNSIVGQLQRLRTSVGDLESTARHGFDEQIKEFQGFAKHMSEAFSKAIIEELQAVIREFNETMSEQFGENFKQLNVAVGRLVAWQEKYKQQMIDLKLALDNAVNGIQQSESSLNAIEQSASKIPEHISRMEKSNNTLNAQIEKMSETLGGFAEMKDKAINAMPEIKKNVEEITANLRTTAEDQTIAVNKLAADYQDLMEQQENSTAELLHGFAELRTTNSDTANRLQSTIKQLSQQLVDELSTAAQDLHAEVEKISKELSVSVTNTTAGITEHLETTIAAQKTVQREMLDGVQTSFDKTISNTTNKINGSIIQLDEAMQNEIGSVVRAMAENLSGVTEQFVADYTPLLEATRRIVEIGGRANQDD